MGNSPHPVIKVKPVCAIQQEYGLPFLSVGTDQVTTSFQEAPRIDLSFDIMGIRNLFVAVLNQ
jgi:hypothetical protein